jgi:hypothetical protein
MSPSLRLTLSSACLVAAAACQDPPTPETDSGATPEPAAEATPATLPLKEIMAALEADLADVAHGIWIDDAGVVSAAATRIADHPRVPPEQMATIQSLLGEAFGAFAQMDRQVHDDAVALAEAANSGRPLYDLLEGAIRIQNGCLACHTAFRPQVSEALAADGP